MGDFAELNIRFKLKEDIPDSVIYTLDYMASRQMQEPAELPDHPLFKSRRWNHMLHGNDDPAGDDVGVTIFEKDRRDNGLFIFVRSVYKDRGEVDLFFDWIYPYIDALWLEFLGYIKYDTNDHPQLIYYTEDGICVIAIKRNEDEHIGTREVNLSWEIADLTTILKG